MAAINKADHTPDLQTQTRVLTEGKGEVKLDFRGQSSVSNYCPSRNVGVPIGAFSNLVSIKAHEKFNRTDEGLGIFYKHMVDIPRIKFSRNADIAQIGHLWIDTNHETWEFLQNIL